MNITKELLFGDYFFAKAICGAAFNSKKYLHALCAAYLINADEEGAMYCMAESEEAENIKNVNDFNRRKRLNQYLGASAVDADGDTERLITVKGNALELAAHYGAYAGEDATQTAVYKKLTAAANSGVIPVLRVVGLMQCEGIFFRQDKKQGIEKLKKAADWNNLEAFFPLVVYEEKKRARYVNKLFTLTRGTPFEEIADGICAGYGITPEFIGECELLNKVFGAGTLKEDVYSPQYAKILYGGALSYGDRERLLLSQDKKALTAAEGLPINLKSGNIACDKTALAAMPFIRPREQNTISRALNNIDLRAVPTYRPMCLCCQSEYITESYARAIEAMFAGSNVAYIRGGELSKSDFIPTDGNVFVSSCDDGVNNVFIFILRGEIKEDAAEHIRNFLISGKRRKFRLQEPELTIDLSPVLPVCLCDSQNEKWLKEVCDIIPLASIDEQEYPAALEDVVEAKTKLYGVPEITFERGYFNYDSTGIDAAEKILDKAIREHREKGKPLSLTCDVLDEYKAYGKDTYTFGFGGTRQ